MYTEDLPINLLCFDERERSEVIELIMEQMYNEWRCSDLTRHQYLKSCCVWKSIRSLFYYKIREGFSAYHQEYTSQKNHIINKNSFIKKLIQTIQSRLNQDQQKLKNIYRKQGDLNGFIQKVISDNLKKCVQDEMNFPKIRARIRQMITFQQKLQALTNQYKRIKQFYEDVEDMIKTNRPKHKYDSEFSDGCYQKNKPKYIEKQKQDQRSKQTRSKYRQKTVQQSRNISQSEIMDPQKESIHNPKTKPKIKIVSQNTVTAFQKSQETVDGQLKFKRKKLQQLQKDLDNFFKDNPTLRKFQNNMQQLSVSLNYQFIKKKKQEIKTIEEEILKLEKSNKLNIECESQHVSRLGVSDSGSRHPNIPVYESSMRLNQQSQKTHFERQRINNSNSQISSDINFGSQNLSVSNSCVIEAYSNGCYQPHHSSRQKQAGYYQDNEIQINRLKTRIQQKEAEKIKNNNQIIYYSTTIHVPNVVEFYKSLNIRLNNQIQQQKQKLRNLQNKKQQYYNSTSRYSSSSISQPSYLYSLNRIDSRRSPYLNTHQHQYLN